MLAETLVTQAVKLAYEKWRESQTGSLALSEECQGSAYADAIGSLKQWHFSPNGDLRFSQFPVDRRVRGRRAEHK